MTTATGNLSATLYNLETLLASSATFRTGAGAADVAAARSFIHWLADAPPANQSVWAWIKTKEGWKADSQGSGNSFWVTMPLQILVQRADDDEDTAKERQIKFLNWLGAVVSEMLALAGTGGYLHVTSLTISNTMLSDDHDPDGPYQQAMLDVQIF